MKLQGNQSTIDDFIKDMDYISINPDDSIEYDPKTAKQEPQPAE